MMRAFAVAVASILLTVSGSSGADAGARPAPVSGEPVVLIGVPGLRWSDLNPGDTPAMWRLADNAAIGSFVVRGLGSRACPADGWLMVSAGTTAAVDTDCGPVAAPSRTSHGAKIPDLAGVRVQNAGSDGQVWGRVGALGEAIHAAGGCTSAVGPGAALGLADTSGVVDYYAPDVQTSAASAWTRCPVTAVDVGTIIGSTPGEPRRAAVRDADAVVGSVLAKAPAGSRIVLAGLSDDAGPAHLHVAIVADGADGGRYLGSDSTRRPDVVTLPGLAPTVAALVDTPGAIQAPVQAGSGWGPRGARPALASAAAGLNRNDVAAVTTESIRTGFVAGLVALVIVVLAAAVALARIRPAAPWRARAQRLITAAAAVSAAAPVSSLLAGLVPWPRSSHPALAMVIVTLVLAGVIAAVALGRGGALRPIIVLTGTTVAVVAVDLIAGLSLQLDNPLGYTAIEGARYYGMGNVVFAVYATALLIFAATVASWGMSRRGWRRRSAASLVVALGLVGVAIDGLPGWGSDFGGVIALIPGIGVTALLVAGLRVSVLRVAALGVVAAGTVLAIAFADHARGAGRETHLGRFAGELISGQAGPIIDRKLHTMLLTAVYIPILVVAVWLVVALLTRPRWAGAAQRLRSTPGLLYGLAGTATAGLVGMFVNDSGAIVAASVLLLAVPLTIIAILSVEVSPDAVRSEAGPSLSGAGQPAPNP